ncbi:MAG: DUF2849 domain-containing protein [Hyphomicrobiales bacterium]|nr:MAG: DUF2849 domain-containing protein [Hyphomicrobiales bacterium]
MANEAKAGPKASPKSKGPQLPVVLSANNLLEGDVVFLVPGGWTRNPAEAEVANDTAAAEDMQARAAAAVKANLVVDPYLVPVVIDAGGMPVARHFRELIRQKGPSTHPDFGKEAAFRNTYAG